jgi:hypothetical protein
VPEDKLGRQQALGSPGLFRRVQDEPVAALDRLERARAVLREAEATGRVRAPPPNQLVVPGPSLSEMMPAAKAARVEKKGRGRPKVGGERPWEAAGMSRRTWYRRKAAEEEVASDGSAEKSD